MINRKGNPMRLHALIAAALLCAAPAFAHQGVHIENPYARTNGGIGASGAIFLEIVNHADTDERLIGVASDVAEKVEMHTHTESADGVMQMSAVPKGFPIAALQGHALKRGSDHIMLMGLKQDLKDGDIVHLTLTFEHAGVVEVDVPVDNARKPAAMGDMQGMDHSKMDHDSMEAAPAN
jgi:copper(I)-binding protein